VSCEAPENALTCVTQSGASHLGAAPDRVADRLHGSVGGSRFRGAVEPFVNCRYALVVAPPEGSLDELLSELAGVLSVMTASEELWLTRLRRLQPDQPRQSVPHDLSVGHPEPAQQQTVTNPSAAVQDEVPRPRVVPTASAPEEIWPTASSGDQDGSSGDNRNYNYFAELDEKLARLRERNFASRGA
jgi:hypothetical protein